MNSDDVKKGIISYFFLGLLVFLIGLQFDFYWNNYLNNTFVNYTWPGPNRVTHLGATLLFNVFFKIPFLNNPFILWIMMDVFIVATILLYYKLLAYAFDDKVALLSAFMMGISPITINMAKVFDDTVFGLFLCVLSSYWFFKYQRTINEYLE